MHVPVLGLSKEPIVPMDPVELLLDVSCGGILMGFLRTNETAIQPAASNFLDTL